MSTNSVSAVAPTNSLTDTASLTTTATGRTQSDRDLFMTLLVAQLKNQDPLAPQDGAEFVAQLAQFNSLDQLVGIRDSIDRLTQILQQQQTQPAPTVPTDPTNQPEQPQSQD